LGPNIPSSGTTKEAPFLHSACFPTRISTPRLGNPLTRSARFCFWHDAEHTLASHFPSPRLPVPPLPNIYIILYYWRVRKFHGFQTYRLSGDLGECSRSRLLLGFPASSGRYVFPFMYPCIWYWAESLYLCMAKCQFLDMYCSVTNACTRVVSFLHLYHACDVFATL